MQFFPNNKRKKSFFKKPNQRMHPCAVASGVRFTVFYSIRWHISELGFSYSFSSRYELIALAIAIVLILVCSCLICSQGRLGDVVIRQNCASRRLAPTYNDACSTHLQKHLAQTGKKVKYCVKKLLIEVFVGVLDSNCQWARTGF